MDFGQQTLVQNPSQTDSTRLICHCLGVSEQEIREAIVEHEPQSIRGVSQACGAGAGCMSCHRHIRRMLNERVVHRRSLIVGESATAEQTCDDRRHC
jgi:bacterioferritin-associated ferredoxin